MSMLRMPKNSSFPSTNPTMPTSMSTTPMICAYRLNTISPHLLVLSALERAYVLLLTQVIAPRITASTSLIVIHHGAWKSGVHRSRIAPPKMDAVARVCVATPKRVSGMAGTPKGLAIGSLQRLQPASAAPTSTARLNGLSGPHQRDVDAKTSQRPAGGALTRPVVRLRVLLLRRRAIRRLWGIRDALGVFRGRRARRRQRQRLPLRRVMGPYRARGRGVVATRVLAVPAGSPRQEDVVEREGRRGHHDQHKRRGARHCEERPQQAALVYRTRGQGHRLLARLLGGVRRGGGPMRSLLLTTIEGDPAVDRGSSPVGQGSKALNALGLRHFERAPMTHGVAGLRSPCEPP